jgi:superfamily II DNA or RNA helicase
MSASSAPPLPELAEPVVPAPPRTGQALLRWADAHGVTERLDDVLVGPGGHYASGYSPYYGVGYETPLTFRQVFFEPDGARKAKSRYFDLGGTALEYLHRIAILLARQRASRAWLDRHGQDPADEILATFLRRLQSVRAALVFPAGAAPRPAGTFHPRRIELVRTPVPALFYWESSVAQSIDEEPRPTHRDEVGLLLLGWDEGPLRWTLSRGDPHEQESVPEDRQHAALGAIIDLVRDPRQREEQEALLDVLRSPAWQFALGTLDEELARLRQRGGAEAAGGRPGEPRLAGEARQERLAFRVVRLAHGGLDVRPVVQRRGKNGAFSAGSRLEWFNVPQRPDLTAADRRVFLAHEDRFARQADSGRLDGPLKGGQLFAILRALIDHPAVFLEGERDTSRRLDIRQGRMRLRFGAGSATGAAGLPPPSGAAGPAAAGAATTATTMSGSLTPQFELLGVTLLATEVAQALRDQRHFIFVHDPAGVGVGQSGVQVLLAEISPEAAAVVKALAVAPTRFPAESHDALAARLEPLQESMDIEFPSEWTRTIAPADGRMVVRLEMLASGAVQLGLAVRPVKLGPTFLPGEGPVLVLEGQGAERHGARRAPQAERQTAFALAERLGLAGGNETEPFSWRVGEGDPALHLVAELKDLGDTVSVEWADDAHLFSLGSVGRSSMRMQVADRRDWFQVEGGAQVKMGGGKTEVVPLAVLFAAIREGRRYVPVGPRGFVRIEDTLRQALEQAEAAVFDSRGILEVSRVGSDPLMGLVEREAQIEASAAFTALRRRMREGQAATPALPAELEGWLRPYQKEGVAWMARLAHWGAGAILADEMGLGKTIQTLAILAHRAAKGPALVVAPTSVVSNWLAEAARFTPELRLKLYRGAARAALLEGLGAGDVLVTSYTVATLDAEALAPIAFGTLVVDEAQSVKNATTERARALRDLKVDWRLGLTGTPIENRLGELWSILRVVSPGLLGSWEQFRARYAVPIEKFGDDQRRRSLALLLRPFVLRRLKSEVARELPPRTEVVRMVQLSAEEQALYEELRASTLAEADAARRDPDRDAQGLQFVLLAALTRLRQLCCHPRLVYPRSPAGSTKAAYLLELLDELRAGGHKVLVFSQFRSFLDILAPRLRQHRFQVLVLDGTTPPEVREQRIAAFQAGGADVFLISLKAGGFGLNLTAADTVIHLDPWWNPAVEDQATARAHRIGQTRPVTAVRLVARGTIEEAVLGLHEAKRALAAGILEGTETAAALDSDELMKLIRRGFEVDLPVPPPSS